MKRRSLLLALMLTSARLDAQIYEAPKPISEGKLLIANSIIGATTAGIYRAITHKSIVPGIARGAIAGAGVYAGKRLIGNGQAGYWWLGREVSSVASSEISNAGLGLAPLQRVVLPIGPIRLHIDRLSSRKVAPRLDIATTIAAITVGTHHGTQFGWRESLSTGTLVFLTAETSDQIGNHAAGVLSISQLAPDGSFPPLESKRRILSHEMIHASQYDLTFNSLSELLRGTIEKKIPAVARPTRYIDLNLILPVDFFLNSFMSYQDRVWEREAVTESHHVP